MKHLLLLRHAKSSWDDARQPDIERPLNRRGEKEAPHVAETLRHHKIRPDHIICSTAVRARQTLDAVLKASKLDIQPEFTGNLYGATSTEILEMIRALPDESACVLLVGHNPGFEEAVGRFTGKQERMPTAALACITFAVESWQKVFDGEGKLAWLATPKERKEDG